MFKIDPDAIYRINELAEIAGITPATVYKYVRDGKIKTSIGSRKIIFIFGRDFISFIKGENNG